MFKDAELFNEEFHDAPFARADFSQSELTNCSFHNCDLRRSDWLGAVVKKTNFISCDFSTAFLTGVRFENCTFDSCNFDEAYIFRSQLKNCDLAACSMNDTMLSTVDFHGTDFINVRWKGTCINSPPIIIDGIEYPVVILDNGYMHAGCEFNTYDYFFSLDNRYLASTEGLRSARFGKRNREWVLKLLSDRGLYSG